MLRFPRELDECVQTGSDYRVRAEVWARLYDLQVTREIYIDAMRREKISLEEEIAHTTANGCASYYDGSMFRQDVFRLAIQVEEKYKSLKLFCQWVGVEFDERIVKMTRSELRSLAGDLDD